ncbi:hypothetical protein [Phytohabitans kaempferiae]|uniref:DUF304 domain-containing protein n=1 Tax=Phytohabitans kaempferiae TaxID=1620943 RepID=A0ABV6M4N4_9ACTN
MPWRWRPRGADVGGGVPDFPITGDEPIGFLIAIGVFAVIVVLPAIIVATIFVAEWLLLLLLLPIVTVLRVGFGMPWTVVARTRGGVRYSEQVVGWRQSRALIKLTRSDVEEYGEPRALSSVM